MSDPSNTVGLLRSSAAALVQTMLRAFDKSARNRLWRIDRRATVSLVVSIQLAISGLVAAQTPNETLSLDACIAVALENHPAIRASQAGYCGAVDQTAIAKSYLMPDIRADVTYTYLNEPLTVDVDLLSGQLGDRLLEAATFFEIARQAGGATAVAALDDLNGPAFTQAKQAVAAQIPPNISVGLLGRNSVLSQIQLMQPLWTHGKLTSRVEQSCAGVAIAKADILKIENEIAFGVARAYLTALFSEELYNVAIAASGYSEGVEQLAQSLVDEGDEFVSMADVLRARTFRSLYEEQAVGFRVSRERALAGLKLAMGVPQGSLVETADRTLPTERIDTSLEMLKQRAFAERPELRKANQAMRVAGLESKIARAEFFPNVAAFASYNTITDDANYPNPVDPNRWVAGVTATMPLFSGGRRHAQVRQAAHAESQISEQRRLLAQAVEQEVEDAYLELSEMAGRTNEAAVAVTSAEKTQDAFRGQFDAGVIGPGATSKYYEDLLTTRLLLATARVRYFQALFGYNMALARLKLVVAADPRADLSGGPTNEVSLQTASDGDFARNDFVR